MTFCVNWEGCEHGEECPRAYTKEIRESAFLAGLPVSLAGFPIATCEEWIDDNKTRVVGRSRQ